MLAKKHRLNLSQEENSSVFRKGDAFFTSSRFFLAYFRKNDSYLKASCIAPKGGLNKATKRNYYRRLLYSFLEESIKEKKVFLADKKDLVIVLKKTFSQKEDELNKDFNLLLESIKKNSEK